MNEGSVNRGGAGDSARGGQFPAKLSPSTPSKIEEDRTKLRRSTMTVLVLMTVFSLQVMGLMLRLAGLVLDHEHVEARQDEERGRLSGQEAAEDRSG